MGMHALLLLTSNKGVLKACALISMQGNERMHNQKSDGIEYMNE
jgi:hypothetical protein